MMFSREIEHGGYPTDDGRTIYEKRRDADLYTGIGRKKSLDTRARTTIGSLQTPITAPTTPSRSRPTMTLTYKAASKNGKAVYYTGAAQTLRFPIGALQNKVAPPTIEVADGVFAGPKAPKAKLSAEERKALRAAQPKPTEAQRIALAEARLEKRKAKLAAAAAQPSL